MAQEAFGMLRRFISVIVCVVKAALRSHLGYRHQGRKCMLVVNLNGSLYISNDLHAGWIMSSSQEMGVDCKEFLCRTGALHRPDRSSDLASRPRMISICLDLMAFLFSRQRFDSILLSFETSSSQSKKWNGIQVSEPCMSVDRLV